MATLKKSKGNYVEKSAVPPSFPGKESSMVGSTIPVEKGFAIPIPSDTMYNRTKSKRKAAVEQAKPKVNTYFSYTLCYCLLRTYEHCPTSCTYLFPPFSPFFFFLDQAK